MSLKILFTELTIFLSRPFNHRTRGYWPRKCLATLYVKPTPVGRGVLPSNRLMGMCRWMGSHFLDWIDYNGVAFSIELQE